MQTGSYNQSRAAGIAKPQYFSMRGLMAWFQERFPAVNIISGLILFFVFTSFAMAFQGSVLKFSLFSCLGALGVVSHFFVLRVFDEYKDFTTDLVHYPLRVLQSGRLQLVHLKNLAIPAVLFEIGISIAAPGALQAWGLMMIYSYFMYKEFFVPRWLNQRLFLYSLSHMMIVPFMANWIYALSGADYSESVLWAPVILATLSGMCFEITRKLKGREEEQDSLLTYSKIWSPRKLLWITAAMTGLNFLSFMACVVALGRGWTSSLLPIILNLLFIASLWKYAKAPSVKNRKANEAILGLAILAQYILIILFAVWK